MCIIIFCFVVVVCILFGVEYYVGLWNLVVDCKEIWKLKMKGDCWVRWCGFWLVSEDGVCKI